MSKKRSISQIFGLLLFLVILPGGSWFYLQKGFDYQKKARAKLLDYGQIPNNLELLSTDGQNSLMNTLKGKLSVFSFVNKDELSPEKMETWRKLYDQFEETQKVVLVMGSLEEGLNLSEVAALPKGDNCVYLNKTASEKLLAHASLPQIDAARNADGRHPVQQLQDMTSYPYYMFSDTLLTIRNYYNANDEAALREMVEHIAMMIPRERSKKPKLLREKEK